MRNVVKFLAVAASVALAFSCNSTPKAPQEPQENQIDSLEQARLDSLEADAYSNLPEEPLFEVKTNMGTMTIKLYGKTPKHRDNFVKLAKAHFYDSLLFHRVIPGFMIQGGDPESKHAPAGAQLGSGGPGYTIPAEILTEYYHKKGAIAAARLGDMANPYRESSGSQFYIVQDDMGCYHLDGQYTVFGETVKGLEVIDKIAAVQTDRFDRPERDVVILSVTPVKQ